MAVKRVYDVEIKDAKGKNYGFMLAGGTDRKEWNVRDVAMFPPSLVTGGATYADFQPESKILLEETDWRKGFQDEIFETAKKYHKTTDCDCRFKGKILLSPKKLTTLAFPDGSTPAWSVGDGELEYWTTATNLTGWTETGDGVDREDTEHKTGSHCAKKKYVASEDGTFYQNVTWEDAYQGFAFTATVWVKSTEDSATTQARISIYDGQDTTDGSWSHETTWTQATVSKTLASDATELRVIVEYDAHRSEHTIYMDDVEISMTGSGSVVKIVNFGDDIVVAAGRYLYQITGGALSHLKGFDYTITDLCVFGDYLHIAQGLSVKYWYTSDLSSFTQCTLDNSTAQYMSNIQNTQFWINDTANTMRDSDNPINGGTAFAEPAYTLPNSASDITALVDNQDGSTVYARKEDQVYYLSGSDVLPLIPELSAEASTTNVYDLYTWQGSLYIPSGINAFYEMDSSDIVTTLSPVKYAPGDTDFDGKVLAIATDQAYMYIVLENGTKIEVLSGHWETVAGATQWWWHTLYEITSSDATAALISNNDVAQRLYIGTDTASNGIYYFKLPVSYSDPLKESEYEVQASGTFYTPWLESNFATTDKYWSSIRVNSQNFRGVTTIKVYYQAKGDDDWTSLGYCSEEDYTSSGSGASFVFTYPDEVTDKFDIGVTSERVRFKFELATSTDELSPVIKGYSGECRLVPSISGESIKKKEIDMTIRAADNLQNLSGVSTRSRVAGIINNIETLNKANKPFEITGPEGVSLKAHFKTEGTNRVPGVDPKTNKPEMWIKCLMEEEL